MKTFRNGIEKALLELIKSYEETGGINHLMGPNLPTQEDVAELVEDIKALIFPGFAETLETDFASIDHVTTESGWSVVRRLVEEVRRCMEFKNRTDTSVKQSDDPIQAEHIVLKFMESLPFIRRLIQEDIQATLEGDPAAKSFEEIILSYPGIEAITVHRSSHIFWEMGVPLLPRMMSEWVHRKTGIDIHPGATIGRRFCIDHGTGIVIGETCHIGEDVKLYQGVTLGALSVKKNMASLKRHPTIEDMVTIYAGATILGGETVIGHHSMIGGNVWLTKSVPPHSVVSVKPQEYILGQQGFQSPNWQI